MDFRQIFAARAVSRRLEPAFRHPLSGVIPRESGGSSNLRRCGVLDPRFRGDDTAGSPSERFNLTGNRSNLRKARHAKGLLQETLAHDAGVARRYLSRIETGGTWVGMEIIVKLAAVLEVRPADLLQEPEPPRRGRRCE